MIQRSVYSMTSVFASLFILLSGLNSVVYGYRTCTDLSNLHSKVADSPIIVHAKVAELFGHLAEVLLIKVYKGQEIIDQLPKVLNMQGKPIIFIGGVNTVGPACPNNVRRLQAKLWLAQRGSHPRQLILKHGLIDLTTEVMTIVKDTLDGKIPKGQVILPMQSDDPCRHTTCKYGAECHLDAHSRKAVCLCPKSCPITGISTRVCGTDAVTYANECELRRSACLHMSIIEIQHAGYCGRKVNPCKWKLCYLGGRCRSLDGINAECECSKACEFLRVSRRREYVCGSDMRQYYSMCQLKEEACRSQRYIGVKFRGRCPPPPQPQQDVPQEQPEAFEYKVENSPCLKIKCPSNSKCIFKNGKAACVCQKICPVLYRPVCGSDGITYPNKCQLKRNSCVRNRTTSVAYNAPCTACKFIKCKFHSRCELDKDSRRPSCRCIPENECPTTGDYPVCGSDSVTYMSECHMKISACRQMKHLTVITKGNCPEENICRTIRCSFNATCVQTREFHATCSCAHITCHKYPKKPVCGSDGKTYINECHFYRERCEKQENLQIVRNFQCNPCADFKCPYGRKCKLDMERVPYCACDYQCENIDYKPVCTNDGRTFDNECLMRHAACSENTHLRVFFRQSCDSATERNPCLGHKCLHPHHVCRVDRDMRPTCLCPEQCPPVFRPVCGSDIITYDNECELKRKTCIQKKDVKINYEGPCNNINLCLKKHPECKNHEICRLSSNQNPICECPTCPAKSTAMGNRVCGSDGKTYQHACELFSKACREKSSVVIKNHGPCDLCKNKVCKNYAICKMDHFGKADCVCPSTCVYVNNPVCGSNGKSYMDECFLRVESCQSQTLIEVVAQGPCKPCPNNCPLGSMCLNGRCVCRKKCSSMPMEVCGTDGVYYRNECEMKRIGCLRKVNIEIDMEGNACRGRNRVPQIPTCQCNELGSLSPMCDPLTNRCRCKTGVVGQRCDRCNTSYWGLRTNQGCKPCACDRRGSSRYDCDQMTGQCVCKPGVKGQRCNRCPVNKKLTNEGCEDVAVVACQKVKCAHGAVCKFSYKGAKCVCDIRCQENRGTPVCGRDGQTYQSECALKKENCKRQKTVLTDYAGPCKQNGAAAHDAVIKQPVYEEKGPKRKIGDFCLNHKQCSASIAASRCAYGQCECPPSQTASPDRKSCVESFRLLSADEKAITKDAGINFDSESFIKFPPVMKIGRHIGLNITLAPSNPDGLIFYNGPTARHSGDFISLSLQNGYVIYRFNLGSGILELRNRKKLFVAGEQTHTIYIERRGRKGTLIVDSEKPVIGRSPGRLRSLDLKKPFVIGNVNRAMALSNVDTRESMRSFKGCLLSFIVFNKRTNKQFNFMQESESLQKYGTEEACIPKRPDPCLSNPCLNGGRCNTNYEGKFNCKCPDGTFGDRCEKNMKTAKLMVKTAEFNGNTIIKIPTTRFTLRKRIDLEIWFLSTHSNGLIALMADEDGEHYFSIILIKRIVHVIIRNNNGISTIQTDFALKLNEWNKLVVKKGRKFISLVVNGNRRARARIVPRFFKSLVKEKRKMYVHFNVRGQPLFLGGYPADILSSSAIGTDVWFRGAIQKVILNRKPINLFLDDGILRYNVSEWKGAPCGPSHSVCGRGTVCEPRLNSAFCRCVDPPCEHAMQDNPNPDNTDGPINFDGNTILKMKNMITSKVPRMRKNNIRVVLKTTHEKGLIALMTKSRKSSSKRDFFLLALRDGYPELAINLGRRTGLIRISSKVHISDNKWHTIHALRNGNLVTLLVDGSRQAGFIRTTKSTLSTDGTLWVGGSNRPVKGFPLSYGVGFSGCIDRLYISEEPVIFSRHVRVKMGRLAPCSLPFEF